MPVLIGIHRMRMQCVIFLQYFTRFWFVKCNIFALITNLAQQLSSCYPKSTLCLSQYAHPPTHTASYSVPAMWGYKHPEYSIVWICEVKHYGIADQNQ